MEVLTHDCHDGVDGPGTMIEMNPSRSSILPWESITRDRDIDSLNPASGMLLGCMIGITLWLILAVLIMTF